MSGADFLGICRCDKGLIVFPGFSCGLFPAVFCSFLQAF